MGDKTTWQIWNLLGIAVLINALFSAIFMLSATPSEIWLADTRTFLFLPASLVAHFSFLFFFIALIALSAHKLRLHHTYWYLLTLTLFSLLLLIIIVDSRVFSLYRFHLNGMTLNMLRGGATQEILSFSWSMWISIIAIVLLVVIAEYQFIKWFLRQKLYSGKRCWQAILVLMISTQLFYGYKDAVADSAIMMQIKYIPWAQPLTMKRTLRKAGILEETTAQYFTQNKKYSAINYPKSPLICNNPKNLNYLMIIIDSLRFDMLNAEVMPNTFKFSRSAQVFNQHWSTSNSTRFGLFGLFYGIPSTYWFDMLKEQRGSVLFDILKKDNYQLHLDASAPLNSPEFDRTIFSAVRTSLQWGNNDSKSEGMNDIETDTIVINRLLTFLDQKHDKPFFAFSFLDAPHGYKLPDDEIPHFQPALKQVNYLELNNDFSPEPFLNLYKSAIYYNDRLLGQVYKKLDEQHLLENTVIIITSDHGQEFNDLKQNYWGHNSNFSEHQVRVPLIIHWPEKTAKQINKMTSHEDIIPSLLTEGFACQNEVSDYSTGFSLFDEKRMPKNRSLLLTNWNDKAIFTGDTYYKFTPFGTIEILNKNYKPDNQKKVDQNAIQQKLTQTSQFLK